MWKLWGHGGEILSETFIKILNKITSTLSVRGPEHPTPPAAPRKDL